MATIFSKAPTDAEAVMARLITERFPELDAAGILVDLVFATSDKDGKPALKLHGNPCAGIASVLSLVDRLATGKDCRIKICAESWRVAKPRRQESLLVHELMHYVVLYSKKTGAIKRDDLGRPRIKMRPDDVAFTGFVQVYQWYGEDSFEAKGMRLLNEVFRQGAFAWGDDSAPQDEAPDLAVAGTI